MIPKVVESKGPEVVERYYCGNCCASITSPHSSYRDDPEEIWNFCPFCGEPIEYEKADQIHSAEQSCEQCGSKLIMEMSGALTPYFVGTENYVGISICRRCLVEHCVQTNCLQCEIGKWPDCPYSWIKKCALEHDDTE